MLSVEFIVRLLQTQDFLGKIRFGYVAIYYDMRDPFWGEKLFTKVAENIVSGLKNPGEALLKRVV